MGKHSSVALLTGCALVACEPGPSGYTSAEFSLDSLPVLALSEGLRIGGLEDADLGFSRIGGVEVAADGRVVVLEQQAREVRVFDREGRLIRRIGRPGSGPGEFGFPDRLGLRGDTLWVSDLSNARLTLFDLEGNILATVPAGGVRVAVPGSNIRIVPGEPLGDGRYGSRMFAMSEGRAATDSMRVPAVIFDADGNVVDTVGTHFMPATPVFQVPVQNHGVLLPAPLDQWPLVTAVRGDTIVVMRPVASNEDEGVFTITRFGDRADTIYHTRLRYRPTVVDPASIVAAAMRDNRGHPAPAAAVEAAIREAIPAERLYPPVVRHIVGRDGTLWLMREDPGGETTRWLVADSAGTPRGTVAIPRTTRLMWVSGEGGWAVSPDDLDVPWLVWLSLRQ